MIHRFGSFEADATRFELRRRGYVVPVQRRVLDTILFFAASGGRLVTPADLEKGPWHGTVVSDAAFKQAIMHARRALVDPERPHQFIVTVHGKGFRWVSPDSDATDRHGRSVVAAQLRSAAPVSTDSTAADTQHGSALQSASGALAAAERMLEHLRAYGDPLRLLDATLFVAQKHLDLGQKREFRQVTLQHERLAKQVGSPLHDWYALLLSSVELYRAGHVGDASSVLRGLGARGERLLGPSATRILASHHLNLAFELTGSSKRRVLRTTERLALQGDAEDHDPEARKLLAAVARLHLGDLPGAQSLVRLSSVDVSKWPEDRHLLAKLVNWTDLAIAFGKTRSLEQSYRRMRPHAGLRVARDFSDWGPVTYHLGRVRLALGDVPGARSFLERAHVESRTFGARCWQLWAGYALARTLHQSGRTPDRRRAQRLLRTVRASASKLALPALRAAVESYRP